MRRSAAVAIVLAGALAGSARAADGPAVEFPLGPWVRAGRPVVVRVRGATRVRGGGSPWATPVGAAGEEFVLQTPRADVTLREVEIDDGASRRTQPVEVRALPADVPVRAAFAGPSAPDRVVVPTAGLPTVREAWLLFDAVDDPPAGLAPAVAAAIPRRPARPLEPLLVPPSPRAFAAAAEAAENAPHLPADVAALLLVLAGAEIVLLLVVGRRPAAARAVWLSAPAVAALAGLALLGRLPGPVRATWSEFEPDADSEILVVLRLHARRPATVSFVPGDGAGVPALVRFDADDASGRDAELGASARIPLDAGRIALLAWRTRGRDGARSEPVPSDRLKAADGWLRELGLRARGEVAPSLEAAGLAGTRGFVASPGPAVRAAAGE